MPRAAIRVVVCLALAGLLVSPAIAGELLHEPETFHIRGTADEFQLERLRYLHAKAGGELAVRLRDDGTLRYLAGEDIAPECRLDGELDESTAKSLVECLLEVSPELFPGLQDAPDGVDWQVAHAVPAGEDGLAMIRLRQRTNGLDVQGGQAALTVRKDRLVSFGGTLFPGDRVALDPDHVFVGRAEVEQAVAADAGIEAIWVRREYDPERGEVVSYLLEKDPDDDQSFRQAVAYFESTKEIELIELGANHSADGATSDVADYLGGWTPTGFNRRESLEVEFRGMSGGSCRMRLDSGTNHSHLIGNPKTQLADGRGKGGDPVEDVIACGGSGFGFGGYPATRIGRAANAHFWVRDLALFTRSDQAAYHDWYRYTEPENLRVVLQEEASCNNGSPACMWPGLNVFGAITEWRMVLAEDQGAHDNLRNMAHEMGHYVGYNYEHYDTFGRRGLLNGATEEGFADHNTLRYALHRLRERSQRPHDANFSTTYFTDHWSRSNWSTATTTASRVRGATTSPSIPPSTGPGTALRRATRTIRTRASMRAARCSVRCTGRWPGTRSGSASTACGRALRCSPRRATRSSPSAWPTSPSPTPCATSPRMRTSTSSSTALPSATTTSSSTAGSARKNDTGSTRCSPRRVSAGRTTCAVRGMSPPGACCR
ncbi:MAG: hypothetical protein AAGC60_27085 [Acidobacteriota bacterium]